MRGRPKKPPQLTDFESYVLSRLDGLTRLVYGCLGAVAIAIATHFIDPSQHWWIFLYP